MDNPAARVEKLRPSVMITTYSEGNSKFSRSAARKDGQQQQVGDNTATKSENSTDFFTNLKRSQARSKILLDLSQIKGPTGSIRGHKDVVRKSLEGIRVAYNRRLNCPASVSTFLANNNNSGNYSSLSGKLSSLQQIDELYLEQLIEDEQDLCVAYVTSLGVIRRTYDDSKLMKSILDLNLIKYEERDIYLNQEYKNQLKVRCNSIVVPVLFVDGRQIGGVRELETMNENGDLQRVLSKFKLPMFPIDDNIKMSAPPKDNCQCCGNAKFIACQSCNGSRKSAIHHFKFNSIALRCIKCDKNDGLVQCPVCQATSDTTGASTSIVCRPAAAGKTSLEPVDENNNEHGQPVDNLQLLGGARGRQESSC